MAYQNLKALRESLSMSQKDFAAALGIRQTTYNGYETGAREPKSDFWIAVAEKYGVTIDYLMGFSNDPHRTSSGKKITPLYSSEAMGVARDYDSLDRWGKQAVRELVDTEKARCEDKARFESPTGHQSRVCCVAMDSGFFLTAATDCGVLRVALICPVIRCVCL